MMQSQRLGEAGRHLAPALHFAGVFLILFQVALAQAGTVSGTTISQVHSEVDLKGGAFMVYLDAAPTSVAGCASSTASAHRFVIDPATQAGKAMIALVMTAYKTGATVDVLGTGDCSVWADAETIQSLTAY